jgi:hypothetical protein
MVDIESFLKYYMNNNRYSSIKYGIEKSEFNPGVPFHSICQAMLERREYSLFNLSLTGLPRKYNNKQKITFDKSFDLVVDNIQAIFNYELSKYLLFNINSDALLNRIIDKISSDDLQLKNIKQYFKLWRIIYNKYKYKLDENKLDEFIQKIEQTPFYEKHNIVKGSISNILSGIIDDLNDLDNKVLSTVIEIKEVSLNILKLIMEYSIKSSNNITIDDIDDLIIDDLNEFDIGYQGSFLKLWKNYYLSNPNNLKIIKEYKLEALINELSQKMFDYYVNLILMFKRIHPTYEIEFTQKFIVEMLNIIIDFYIHLGMEMAEEHAENKCFAQSSKMHFKTLFVSLKRIIPKNEIFNESQLLLIHYTLLTSEKLNKAYEDIKSGKINNGNNDDE